MSLREFRWRFLATILLSGIIAVGIYGWYLQPTPLYDLGRLDVLVLTIAVALGDRLLLPRGLGRSTALSVAVIASLALLGQPPVVVIVMAVGAWLLESWQAFRQEHRVRLGQLGSLTVLAWGLSGITLVVSHHVPTDVQIGESALGAVPVAVVWILLLVASPAVETIEVLLRADGSRHMRYADLLRSGLTANTVVAATATLGALAYPELGAPTVLLMALPLLAAKLGFDRNDQTRRNYNQTLRAMSRLPEQLGAVDPGHGVRCGDVAARAAMELGHGVEMVADIERAAQLHELGRIRTEHGLDLTPEEVASGGAEIVHEAGDLERVARLIAAHRGPVEIGDDVSWVGGAIVRLACDLDLRLTARGDHALGPADASWIRAQGVQPRIAEAVIVAAAAHYHDPMPA